MNISAPPRTRPGASAAPVSTALGAWGSRQGLQWPKRKTINMIIIKMHGDKQIKQTHNCRKQHVINNTFTYQRDVQPFWRKGFYSSVYIAQQCSNVLQSVAMDDKMNLCKPCIHCHGAIFTSSNHVESC